MNTARLDGRMDKYITDLLQREKLAVNCLNNYANR